jgi:formate dehydrogenase iron-sulfur subunit
VPSDGYAWSGLSYDHTRALGHSTWRHVKFVEAAPRIGLGGNAPDHAAWQFSSDVCRHCEHAGCLEACPTGSIVRTEFGGVFVQPDVCNGCGYCVVSCPFGVVDRRPDDGRAFKCTFCYDRQKSGLEPACAKVCPTDSILFGEIEDLRERGAARVDALNARGATDAVLYDPKDSEIGGTHALFIVRGDLAEYNLPASPSLPASRLREAWTSAGLGSAFALGVLVVAFLVR